MVAAGNQAAYVSIFIVINFRLAISFILTPVDTLVILGDSTQLNCTFDVAPDFKAWFRGPTSISIGEDIRDTSKYYELDSQGDIYNLRVLNTTADEEGEYDCTDLEDRERVADAYLYVIENVPICTVQPNNTVIEGEQFIMSCTIDINENAPGYLVWLKDGEEVSRKEGHNNTWETQLSGLDNNAIFDCQLQHETLPPWKWSMVSCEDTIQMNVQYAPYVSIVGDDQVREGADFSVHCEAINANPEEIVGTYWTDPDGETVSDNTALVLLNVTKAHRGEYTCLMSNVFYNGVKGNGTATIEIDVQYLSSVNMTVTPLFNITEGDEVTIHCEAFDGNPDPHRLEMLFEDNVIDQSDGQVLNYTIDSIEASHSGIYQCNAYTLFYNDEEEHSYVTEDIVVYYSPKFVSDEFKYEANINDEVPMTCEVHGFPAPVITWFDPNNELIRGDEENMKITVDGEALVTSTLTVTVADESYYGSYTCRASNSIPPDDEQTMEIVKPDSTSTATAAIITVIVVVLIIAIVLGILYYYKRVAKNQSSNTDYANAGLGTEDYSELTANSGNDRQKPEGVSQQVDPNPYAESTALSEKTTPTGSLEENLSYVCSTLDNQGDKKEGDLLSNSSALHAAVNKQTETADGVNGVNDTGSGNLGDKEDQETQEDVTESNQQNQTTK